MASVIVPTYNAEKYLARCLDSLLAQTLDQACFEIIVINDGSTDRSFAICEDYAARHSNILVLSQANQGVSAARNAGLDRARGKYIFFLDSDDLLSPNTLRDVTVFFEKNNDTIDLVACRILYGMTREHTRSALLDHEGIYALDACPQIALTTMNVAVKNTGLRFDTRLALGEDQLFVTRHVLDKAAIGYVPSAIYYYREHSDSASGLFNHPFFSFAQTRRLFSRLLHLAAEHPRVQDYIYYLILNNISWRMREDRLLSRSMPEMEEQREYLRYVLQKIGSARIAGFYRFSPEEQSYLLALRSGSIPRPDRARQETRCADAGTIHAPVVVHITRLRLRNGTVSLAGYISAHGPEAAHYALSMVVDEQRQRIALKAFVNHAAVPGLGNGFFFEHAVPIAGAGRFFLSVTRDGQPLAIALQFGPLNQINPARRRFVHFSSDYGLILDGEHFTIHDSASARMRGEKAARRRALLRQSKGMYLQRLLGALRLKNKRIWLYTDGHDAPGKTFARFARDLALRDGVQRFYVYSENGDPPSLPRGIPARRLVRFKSSRHKLLFTWSETIFTSTAEEEQVLPFLLKHAYYLDLFRFEVIYLLPGLFTPGRFAPFNNALVDKVAVSTDLERDYLTGHLCFDETNLIRENPAPRERPAARADAPRKILYAPAERSYLACRGEDGSWRPLSYFAGSTFQRQAHAFLHGEALRTLLATHDLDLDVLLPARLSPYAKALDPENDRIAFVAKADPADYAVLVTDFSNIVFEFLALKKPALIFFPDRKEVEAGLDDMRFFFIPPETLGTLYTERADELTQGLETVCPAAGPTAPGPTYAGRKNTRKPAPLHH